MNRRLLLLGGGGHCRSVVDSALSLNIYDEIGIVDFKDSSCLGIPVVGTDDDLPALYSKGWTDAFITLGSIGNTTVRRKLFQLINSIGLMVPAIIDPSAAVAAGTEIGRGVFIGKNAVLNTGASVGDCAIINTGAVVEHDCSVGAFAHVSPGAVLCGEVTVGADAHVGAGAVVRQQLVIGEHALIGAGSVVLREIPAHAKAYGNPCRVVE